MYLVYFRVVKQVKASIIYIFPLSPKLLVICQMSFFAQTIDTCILATRNYFWRSISARRNLIIMSTVQIST